MYFVVWSFPKKEVLEEVLEMEETQHVKILITYHQFHDISSHSTQSLGCALWLGKEGVHMCFYQHPCVCLYAYCHM